MLVSRLENWFPVNKNYNNYDNGDNKDKNSDNDGNGNNDGNNVKEYSDNDNTRLQQSFCYIFWNLDEIYYENRFFKIFQSFSKATPTDWKEMRG